MASFNIQNEYLRYVNRKQILWKNVPNTQLCMDSNKMADTDAKSQASLLHGITFLCTSFSFEENTSLCLNAN